MRWGWVGLVGVVVPSVALADEAAPEPPPVVVVSPPPPEPAPPEPEPSPREVVVTPPLHSHGYEVAIGGTTFSPTLDRTRFTGSGTVGGQSASFDHTGQEMGIRSPRFYGVELEVAYLRRYLALGALFNVTVARADQGSDLQGTYDPSSLRAYSGGIDMAGVIPAGDVSIRVGPVVGLRFFETQLSGFDLTTCRGRRGSIYSCPSEANSQAMPYLEPRLRIDWTPGGTGLMIGGYAAVNVFERPTIGGGIVIGFKSANSTLVP
jgi:hypothetical protein